MYWNKKGWWTRHMMLEMCSLVTKVHSDPTTDIFLCLKGSDRILSEVVGLFELSDVICRSDCSPWESSIIEQIPTAVLFILFLFISYNCISLINGRLSTLYWCLHIVHILLIKLTQNAHLPHIKQHVLYTLLRISIRNTGADKAYHLIHHGYSTLQHLKVLQKEKYILLIFVNVHKIKWWMKV